MPSEVNFTEVVPEGVRPYLPWIAALAAIGAIWYFTRKKENA